MRKREARKQERENGGCRREREGERESETERNDVVRTGHGWKR